MDNFVVLSNGNTVPSLGQGTWYLGDSSNTHDSEVRALRAGVAAGMTLIDTAEMYGEGRSERLVGDAIAGIDVHGEHLLEEDGSIAIPRTCQVQHALENAAADAIELTDEDIALIEQAWPAPTHKVPLDME